MRPVVGSDLEEPCAIALPQAGRGGNEGATRCVHTFGSRIDIRAGFSAFAFARMRAVGFVLKTLGVFGSDTPVAIDQARKTGPQVMNHFDYRDGVLHAEAVNLSELADRVGTPFYCYSTATLERHYRVFADAFAGEKVLILYAMKANSNQSVLRTLARLGAGADVVSGGELKRALAAGIPADRIVFSGVGKTEAELRAALATDIRCINVESEPELEQLSEVARGMDKRAPVTIRVNPDVDAKTHAKITT